VLLYWVTTNLWTMGQQFVMFRTVAQPVAAEAAKGTPKNDGKAEGGRRIGKADQQRAIAATADGEDASGASTKNGATPAKGAPTPKRSEARQQKGSTRDAGSGRRRGSGSTASSKGKGGGRSGEPTRPKR
jgi:YidC/Oxa1 family membrane protein insertase